MSQNADSARDWINREQPNSEQLEQALTAIQRKLSDHPTLSEQQRADLQDAAKIVREEIQLIAYSQDTEDSPEQNTATLDLTALGASPKTSENLDLSGLGQTPDPSIQALQGSAKRQAFEQLKANISNLKDQ